MRLGSRRYNRSNHAAPSARGATALINGSARTAPVDIKARRMHRYGHGFDHGGMLEAEVVRKPVHNAARDTTYSAKAPRRRYGPGETPITCRFWHRFRSPQAQ
jgi:hypothetical protein